VYLIVISSILQKYFSGHSILIKSHNEKSFVVKIKIHAIIFHNISLNASQTPKDSHHNSNPTSKPNISNHIKIENINRV